MKRPSGFDRRPEPRRPGRGRTGDRAAEPSAAPGTGLPEAGPAGAGAPGPGLPGAEAPETAPREADAPERDAPPPLAPTVDLGELRAGRDDAAVAPAGDGRLGAALARLRREPGEDPVRDAEARVRAAERRVRAAGRERKARFRRERRRFSALARARRRRWLIAGSAVAALALFVGVGVLTPLMAVASVRLEGASQVDAAAVEAALAELEGTPLALVEDADVHRALEGFPLIQKYAVERVPPHTLIVRIEERVPVLAIGSDGDGYALYDAAGVVLGASETPIAGVPLGGGAIADVSSPAFASASAALRDMPAELRSRMTAATATSAQDVTFTLDTGVAVLWGDADRSALKSVVLGQMLTALGDRPIEQIDVSSSEAPVFR
ncbi:FtsQ-type POTRA domain-containing protein [Leucobacter allii]|uniref:FtsQ-type POTRA domain-containing protein n=1 Tax=Leucobacter allii TaxID=2932247 RepID=UPI001FD62286|nr:FtsQ-type POTRA domain-containing protein [Leucobacter allii]UOR02936.1 FtsQ-type POTRA domain-containing protein [Leucobacter allii]